MATLNTLDYTSTYTIHGPSRHGDSISSFQDFLPTIPSDISSLIFFYACQPTPDPFFDLESLNPRCERECHPLRLGHVCRSWRCFVWDASELWSTVVLRVGVGAGPSISTEKVIAQIELLREWLGRARSRPLDVFVEELGDNGRFQANQPTTSPTEPVTFEWGDDPAVSGLYDLLAEHSSQWRRIIFYLPQKRCLYLSNLLNAVNPNPGVDQMHYRPYSSLQSTSLHGVRTSGFHQKRGIDFTHSPSLRDVSISSAIAIPDTFACYPTNQITRLTLLSVLRIDPAALFSQFPQLRELVLINYSAIPLPTPLTQPTVHHTLRHLHTETGSDLTFVAMLATHNLTLPALTSLSVYLPGSFYSTDVLLAFFRRSGCALVSFTLQFDVSDEQDLVQILSSPSISPSLKELRISDQASPDAAVKSNQVLNFRRYLRRRGYATTPSTPGLGSMFFSKFDCDKYPEFLPQLEVFEYSGPLTNSAKAGDFLKPLVQRARMGAWGPPESTVPVVNKLKRVMIKSNQASLLSNIDIANDADLLRLREEGVFVIK